jgi:hypothetical protein
MTAMLVAMAAFPVSGFVVLLLKARPIIFPIMPNGKKINGER